MKKFFYLGLLFLVAFEALKVYYIMPMPGSQEMNSIDAAYVMHTYRWVFRIAFLAMMVAGGKQVFTGRRKWIAIVLLLPATAVIYYSNFVMMADHMFLQPVSVPMAAQAANTLPGSRLVIGVENNGEAKAYPVEFLTYHHQVQDMIGGKPMIITYCSVCRTGRVYEPVVNGKREQFRLVGMDHFNAMFEDATTHSWWRQATGEAITGELKGHVLPEVTSVQMTIDKWFALYPHGLVMQEDEFSKTHYDSLARFEQGSYSGGLTGTDTASWNKKSWVVGVQIGNLSKAYDWNALKKEHIIHDQVGDTPLVIVLSEDGKSFAAFERNADETFTLRNDTLMANGNRYDFAGRNVQMPLLHLEQIPAYQEFWHSWLTFHPETLRY